MLKFTAVLIWVEVGPPLRNASGPEDVMMVAGARVNPEKALDVDAYHCEKCGFVELYTADFLVPELDDAEGSTDAQARSPRSHPENRRANF